MFKRPVQAVLGAAALLAAETFTPALAADPATPPAGGAAILMWSPAQQAWGYRNMEKVAPVRMIRRGKRVHPLPLAKAQIDPSFTDGGKTYDTAAYMAAFRASGVLVIKDGKVVLERYGLGRGPNDRWTSFSVAKSVTSTLIGAAIRDGKIKSLDDPVTRYIHELKDSAYEGVTVRQLITMTSGVKWNESYTDPKSDVAQEGLKILEPGVNPVVSYMRRLPREALRRRGDGAVGRHGHAVRGARAPVAGECQVRGDERAVGHAAVRLLRRQREALAAQQHAGLVRLHPRERVRVIVERAVLRLRPADLQRDPKGGLGHDDGRLEREDWQRIHRRQQVCLCNTGRPQRLDAAEARANSAVR